jgi:hypothetical protein
MHWYGPIAWFFSGAFLADFVPHFVQGVSGNGFPTPFANPPGKGLSSPLVNTLWGLLNLVAGALLFHAGNVAGSGWVALVVFFAGIALLSMLSSVNFASKHKE